MILDTEAVARWLEPLLRTPEDIADVFVEERRDTVLEWRDGEVTGVCVVSDAGLSARWRRAGAEQLVFSAGADDAAAREVVRALREAAGSEPLPIRLTRGEEAAEVEDGAAMGVPRGRRRLAALLARHMPRHRLRWTLRETARQTVPARGEAVVSLSRLLSIEGGFTAASRRGDEARVFAFHAPEAEAASDTLREALETASAPREKAMPCPDGETDVVLAGGCAAMFFHEVLSHPGEAGVESPLSALVDARIAAPDLDVRDEPGRLDLFGGYEADDEGTRPRAVKLLDSGRLAGRLTDRAHRGRPQPSTGHGRRGGPSDAPLPRGSNLVVSPGHATDEEMARRLGSGLWIEELAGGSVELTSGLFRLAFPRARRVRRGRLADEIGPGILSGEILAALKGVESGLGRDVRPYRQLGWCAKRGQVVPVGGAAPTVLVRRLAVRANA
jgi:predicted Zn-dependent protease